MDMSKIMGMVVKVVARVLISMGVKSAVNWTTGSGNARSDRQPRSERLPRSDGDGVSDGYGGPNDSADPDPRAATKRARQAARQTRRNR